MTRIKSVVGFDAEEEEMRPVRLVHLVGRDGVHLNLYRQASN